MLPPTLPKNCTADDELREVGFDVEYEGATWRGAVSYDTLAQMFSSPKLEAPVASVRECRIQLVSHSKAIARLVTERIQGGATAAERIVIS